MQIVSNDASDSEANAALIKELIALNHDLKVPTPKEYGIDEKQYFDLLPLMAKQALDSGSPSNNPRIPSVNEVIELYKQVYA